MWRAAIIGIALAGPAYAGVWEAMSGDDIRAALTDRTLIYETATQHFYASGKTLYHAGEARWGAGRIQGNEYCSQWPPNSAWACYRMQAKGDDQLRFIGEGDDITEAVYGK